MYEIRLTSPCVLSSRYNFDVLIVQPFPDLEKNLDLDLDLEPGLYIPDFGPGYWIPVGLAFSLIGLPIISQLFRMTVADKEAKYAEHSFLLSQVKFLLFYSTLHQVLRSPSAGMKRDSYWMKDVACRHTRWLPTRCLSASLSVHRASRVDSLACEVEVEAAADGRSRSSL
ncbi:hypothetical protein P171DRAFT_257000 [Karstenula rhodostoma CBS 690.94]|uniref:Uncharacterized protein n=1 Tax=Karstenula rhodostoma CBS 690.94 TaxID=1392251 RepID=A0A9P4PJN3_9PLEO|nr:hypothetical protein P171DRAFT_257000 [Karstenula rhodostoma CBS 690.94]